MSKADAKPPVPQPPPRPLTWPPPRLERLQGLLWKAILISWAGSIIWELRILDRLGADRVL